MRANGYAGRLEPAQLAYVALTSRLLEGRPINLALMGDPAAGKNATIDAALALIPRKGVYEFTATEDALTGSATDPLPQAGHAPLAPESQDRPETPSVPEPTATKLPPPAGGS
jgi:hypothetical protein